jgi:hypothetical protein
MSIAILFMGYISSHVFQFFGIEGAGMIAVKAGLRSLETSNRMAILFPALNEYKGFNLDNRSQWFYDTVYTKNPIFCDVILLGMAAISTLSVGTHLVMEAHRIALQRDGQAAMMWAMWLLGLNNQNVSRLVIVAGSIFTTRTIWAQVNYHSKKVALAVGERILEIGEEAPNTTSILGVEIDDN